MPYLKLQTNKQITDCDTACLEQEILADLSRFLSEKLRKPEQYIMVALEQGVPMVFSGSGEPAIFMELKSIGLEEANAGDLSEALCSFVEQKLGIPKERMYIEFTNAAGSMWGWNGRTF